MDTKDEVIIKSSEFTGRIYPAKSPFFRGDRPLHRSSAALGIADVRHVDPNVCGVLDNTPEGCLGGWGFGSAEAGEAKPRYLWDSLPIDPTVMEIAVTDRSLTDAEQKALLKK
jgi:hypothetical protein